jgi:hypothetical protein
MKNYEWKNKLKKEKKKQVEKEIIIIIIIIIIPEGSAVSQFGHQLLSWTDENTKWRNNTK